MNNDSYNIRGGSRGVKFILFVDQEVFIAEVIDKILLMTLRKPMKKYCDVAEWSPAFL